MPVELVFDEKSRVMSMTWFIYLAAFTTSQAMMFQLIETWHIWQLDQNLSPHNCKHHSKFAWMSNAYVRLLIPMTSIFLEQPSHMQCQRKCWWSSIPLLITMYTFRAEYFWSSIRLEQHIFGAIFTHAMTWVLLMKQHLFTHKYAYFQRGKPVSCKRIQHL